MLLDGYIPLSKCNQICLNNKITVVFTSEAPFDCQTHWQENPTHAAASILLSHMPMFQPPKGDAACAQCQGHRQQSPITICTLRAGGRVKGSRLQVGFVMPISMEFVQPYPSINKHPSFPYANVSAMQADAACAHQIPWIATCLTMTILAQPNNCHSCNDARSIVQKN